MTTMTDLTKERLDEIEAFHWGEIDCMPEKTDAEMRALVAMAKRTEAAERRVSRLEKHLSLECSEFEEGYQAALAGRDEGYAMAQAAERERDEWKAKFEAVRGSESDALAENDALTFIARTNGFQRDKAERERDALLELLDDWLGVASDCYDPDMVRRTEAALAQPTTEGGE